MTQYIAGLQVADTGVIATTFLDDATAVPGTAVFLHGMAHDQDGRRYVCLWPTIQSVSYIGKIAVRADGAMTIINPGTEADRPGGWALTSRGEVIATTSAPEVFRDGIGLLSNGSVCMSTIA